MKSIYLDLFLSRSVVVMRLCGGNALSRKSGSLHILMWFSIAHMSWYMTKLLTYD
jgi:hypothetical protein